MSPDVSPKEQERNAPVFLTTTTMPTTRMEAESAKDEKSRTTTGTASDEDDDGSDDGGADTDEEQNSNEPTHDSNAMYAQLMASGRHFTVQFRGPQHRRRKARWRV